MFYIDNLEHHCQLSVSSDLPPRRLFFVLIMISWVYIPFALLAAGKWNNQVPTAFLTGLTTAFVFRQISLCFTFLGKSGHFVAKRNKLLKGCLQICDFERKCYDSMSCWCGLMTMYIVQTCAKTDKYNFTSCFPDVQNNL